MCECNQYSLKFSNGSISECRFGVLFSDSQETYEKMTLFRDPSPSAALVASGRATDGISGNLKWVETGENDAKSWNGTLYEAIIRIS